MNNNKIVICLLLWLLSGCGVSTDSTVTAAPAVQSGEQIEQVRAEQNLPSTVAIMPFANETDSEFAFEAVRRTLSNHFSTTNYRWLHWRDVDNRLALAGIDDPSSLSPAQAMELLGVDGVVVGNITHFNKTFAGIYAQIAVGVELTFYNASGDVIWSVEDVRRSHAGGVSTNPVGIIMNALASARHLYGDVNLYRAADDLGRDLVKEFPQPAVLGQREKPSIIDVVHSGAGQYLKYGDTLEIAIEGDANMTAAALVGDEVIDLEEVAPGQYTGSTVIPRDLNLEDAVVTGRLQDSFGQVTSWISPYGLLNVDNVAPAPVTNVKTLSKDGAIEVEWQGPADSDVEAYEVSRLESRLGQALSSMSVMDETALVTGLTNFRPQTLAIRAIDRAGNESEAVVVQSIAAPAPRFGRAAVVKGAMPEVISGVRRLTEADSPYAVSVPTRIATDGVLLIDPGVELRVGSSGTVTVLGELHVFGDRSLPVRVTDAAGQTYSEFLVLQTERPVTLRGIDFTGGGLPLQILAGRPLVESCTFENNRFSAVTISGSARPTIRDSRIAAAGSSGVVIEGQAQPVFVGNEFVANQPFHLQNGSSYQVNLTNNTFEPPASNMTVLGDALLGDSP